MNITQATALYIIVALACLGLGALVICRNPRRLANRAFAFLTLNLAVWTSGYVLIVRSSDPEQILHYLRLTFIAGGLIPASYIYFLSVFPGDKFKGSRVVMTLLGLCSVICALGAFTDKYVVLSGISIEPGYPPSIEYGPVFYVMIAGVIFSILYGYPLMTLKMFNSRGIERRQQQHVLLGTAAYGTLVVLTNVLGPLMGLGNTEAYGPLFLLFMVTVFAYAMVRYHLLDIWFILSRTTVYAISTALVALIFVGAVSLSFGSASSQLRILPILLAALVVAVVLEPVKERVHLILDRMLIKRRYDAHALLSRVSQYASRIVWMDKLLETVANDMKETVGVRYVKIILVSEHDPEKLIIEYSTTAPQEHGDILAGYEQLLDHMRNNPKPLSLEEIVRNKADKTKIGLASQMADLDAYLCVPLKSMTDFVGFILLGQKESEDIFTADDINVFSTMASSLATAINNAHLYHKLDEANLHRARILASMRGGVIAVDNNGRIQTLNDAARTVIGPMDIGDSIDCLPEEIAQTLKQTLRVEDDLEERETILPKPGGGELSVVISSACLKSSDSELEGAMVMIYDLTHIKHLEQNVQRADRLSSIGTLAAGMAHEIKNPLVSVRTFSQLLPTRYEDPEFRDIFSSTVLSAVDRIDSIVTRLLDFARPRPVNFSLNNICKIIQDAIALTENQVKKANVTIKTDFQYEEMLVFCDEQQLHQVLLNLLLNALEAMQQTNSGVLQFSVYSGRLNVSGSTSGTTRSIECVILKVSDTGPGVPEEEIELIFNPFHTTKENGSGLGLSVVHGIVSGHGGSIDVGSAPGHGAEFTIKLPMANQAELVGSKS